MVTDITVEVVQHLVVTYVVLRYTVLQKEKGRTNESQHNKTNKMSVRPAKTQISLGIRPV